MTAVLFADGYGRFRTVIHFFTSATRRDLSRGDILTKYEEISTKIT